MKIENMWKKKNWDSNAKDRYDWLPFAPWISIEIGKLVIFNLVLDFQELNFAVVVFNRELTFYQYFPKSFGGPEVMKFSKADGENDGFTLIVSLAMAWKILGVVISKGDPAIQIMGIKGSK